MEFSGDLNAPGVERSWILRGPDSGGVEMLVLYMGLLYRFQHEGSTSSSSPMGTPAHFVAEHERSEDAALRRIAAELKTLASTGTP